MEITPLYWQLALALGLGLLVGLQRERSGHGAGIRTFGLITLLGAAATAIAGDQSTWVIVGGLLSVGFVVGINSRRINERIPPREDEQEPDPDNTQAENAKLEQDRPASSPAMEEAGLTTITASLIMFVVGAMIVTGYVAPAIAVTGTTVILLHWKSPLHRFVEKIGESEAKALFRLVLLALVILPVLPDATFGPYNVLNPFQIWLMVVLIVGISVVAYIGQRIIGREGMLLGGILGGLISSTATTVSYARRTTDTPGASGVAATVVVVASGIALVRVILEVGVVAPDLVLQILPPFAALAGVMTLVVVAAWLKSRNEESELPEADDPSNLKAAIVFGGLYALSLLAVAAAENHFGDMGAYLVAGLSGLTDVDAISLSTARMMTEGRVSIDTGWRMMMLATLSNLVFKGGAVALLGHRNLLAQVAIWFSIALAGGALVLWLWPVIS